MMKAIQYLVLFLLAILVTESCQKIDFPTPEAKNIVGEWKWIYSVGGFSGNDTIKPLNENEDYQLKFKENGKYKYFINDKLEQKGSYSIKQFTDSWGSYFTLLLDGKSESSISGELTFKGKDTLGIYPINCADCHRAFYVRK